VATTTVVAIASAMHITIVAVFAVGTLSTSLAIIAMIMWDITVIMVN